MKTMRRQDRRMKDEEAFELLKRALYGVLSMAGVDGSPYGVPLSYVYMDGSIYFHCAAEGYKLDNIKNNNQVSFCVVGNVETIPERFTTRYESVIVFGKAVEVVGPEKHDAFMAILNKYADQYMEKGKEYIQNADSKVKVIKVTVESITGKANR